jgi:hypothetical protein
MAWRARSASRDPLRVMAKYRVAYDWPFVNPRSPISQGPHSLRNGVLANDMAFTSAILVWR